MKINKFKTSKDCLNFLKLHSKRYCQFLHNSNTPTPNMDQIETKKIKDTVKKKNSIDINNKIIKAKFGTKFFFGNIPYLIGGKTKVIV